MYKRQVLDDKHTDFFKLRTEFLNIKADKAIKNVTVCPVVKNVQAAVYIEFPCRRDTLRFLFRLLLDFASEMCIRDRSLPCLRRTPTEPPNRPKPYRNTHTPKRDACRRKKPQKPPRQTTSCLSLIHISLVNQGFFRGCQRQADRFIL